MTSHHAFPRLFAAALLATFTLALLTGCDSMFKRKATEGDTMVGVAAEGRVADVVLPKIDHILDDVVLTPMPSPEWTLRHVTDDSLGYITDWQNLVLLGTLDGDDAISQRIQRMLDDQAEQQVRDGDIRVFRQQNVWVRGQTVVVTVAPTLDDLTRWLDINGEVIDDLLSEDRHERMKKSMFSRLEQEDLADSLQQQHGWRLRIPHDYVVVASERDPNFVRLRRMYPTRFITVAWQPGRRDSVTVDKLIRWRDRLGRTYPDTSRSNTLVLDSTWTTLGGVDALRVRGIWETLGPQGGGPYVAYLLEKDGTLYLVDGKLFAPDREKGPYVRHLEVLLSTFEP